MNQSLRTTTREVKAILADASVAETHPTSANRPERGSSLTRYAMHAVHATLMRSGRAADRAHERSTPQWPLKGESISVLGYGVEKIAYRVTDDATGLSNVVSVFHLKSLRNQPHEVIVEKRANYEKYKQYFPDIILPTSFVVLDNPWGDGAKAAYVQPFIEHAEKFSELSQEALQARAATDPVFAENLEHLTRGYNHMLQDGLRPDFSTNNLLVSGSDILVFDTGVMYPSDRESLIVRQSPNYRLIESLGVPAPAVASEPAH